MTIPLPIYNGQVWNKNVWEKMVITLGILVKIPIVTFRWKAYRRNHDKNFNFLIIVHILNYVTKIKLEATKISLPIKSEDLS